MQYKIYNMLYWKNYVDKKSSVRGIAVIYKDEPGHMHYHPVDEEYDLFYGKAIMYINGHKYYVEAPYKVLIPANVEHTIKAVSRFIIMKYNFPKGEFKDIVYTWLSSKL